MGAVRIRSIALVALMGALAAAAVVAVVVVLTDLEGQLTARLLGTAGFLALFSLTGLCAALPVERGVVPGVGVTGVVVSAAAFLLSLAYVWEAIPTRGPDDVRPLGVAVVAAVALGWTSLLLMGLRRSAAVTAAVVATVAAVGTLAGLLLAALFADPGVGEGLARAVAVAAILAVLGSFLTPMLSMVVGTPGGRRTGGEGFQARPVPR